MKTNATDLFAPVLQTERQIVQPKHFRTPENYLPGMCFGDFLEEIEARAPKLHSMLSLSSSARVNARLKRFCDTHTGFEAQSKGGRGDAYRLGQKLHPLARKRGVKCLLEILERDHPGIVLDALGGSGTITRVRSLLSSELHNPMPFMVTSDLDADQVAAALEEGFPAIRQPAQDTFFKNSVFDAVLFAFGTHHIPKLLRPRAWSEAKRILRPNGRIVVHDFETGTPTERWYSTVLDLGTETGHDCLHFETKTLQSDLIHAGFQNVEISYVYEPFEMKGESEQDAIVGTMRHIVNLFGLEKLRPKNDTTEAWMRVMAVLGKYFTIPTDIPLSRGCARQIRVRKEPNGFVAEFPRVSIVATGVK